MSLETKYYEIPVQYWQRIHFIRPRFKGNIENVLLYMANECCKIPKCSCQEYSDKYFKAIRMFPGNIDKAAKTLNNWRTETPALFGFYKEDKTINVTETSKMAIFLNENQDLTQFMRLFLFTFQFPGGHLKPQELIDIINSNIRFKPAQWIIRVLMEGNKLLAESGINKDMSINAEEATYCIFNDIRVTSGQKTPKEVAQTILNNRKLKLKYYRKNDTKIFSSKGVAMTLGDVKRYAQDILDYMELAFLLEEQFGYFKLKPNELSAINIFANDNSFFTGYEDFYGKHVTSAEISSIEPLWFSYVNDHLNPNLFKTDISSIFKEDDEINVIYQDRISQILTSESTKKDVGNLGESLVHGHEKMRLKIAGYDDNYIKLVQIVDSPSYHPGFDIDSFEGDGTLHHRYIEVKTTISKQKIQLYSFHMSPNEWSVADTTKEHYYVYRLMLSENDKTLFVLRNPVQLYKSDFIKATPRNGMEVSFLPEKFPPTELLLWKE